jgi:hypothetical protein
VDFLVRCVVPRALHSMSPDLQLTSRDLDRQSLHVLHRIAIPRRLATRDVLNLANRKRESRLSCNSSRQSDVLLGCAGVVPVKCLRNALRWDV